MRFLPILVLCSLLSSTLALAQTERPQSRVGRAAELRLEFMRDQREGRRRAGFGWAVGLLGVGASLVTWLAPLGCQIGLEDSFERGRCHERVYWTVANIFTLGSIIALAIGIGGSVRNVRRRRVRRLRFSDGVLRW